MTSKTEKYNFILYKNLLNWQKKEFELLFNPKDRWSQNCIKPLPVLKFLFNATLSKIIVEDLAYLDN